MKQFIFLAAAMLLTGPVQAQNSVSSGASLETILGFIEEHGYAGEIINADDHAANVAIGENFFGVDGYNCSGDVCTEYLFSIGYDLENGFPLDKLNDWNSTRLGGRAWLDAENDPWVDHVISISGAEDQGAFDEGFLLWLDVIASFEQFLSENSGPGA